MKLSRSGIFPTLQRGLSGPSVFVLSDIETQDKYLHKDKKTRMSEHGELGKNKKPQAEMGEGPCLTSPTSSGSHMGPKSSPVLFCHGENLLHTLLALGMSPLPNESGLWWRGW